jgi:hypothetical protein
LESLFILQWRRGAAVVVVAQIMTKTRVEIMNIPKVGAADINRND